MNQYFVQTWFKLNDTYVRTLPANETTLNNTVMIKKKRKETVKPADYQNE